MTSAARHGETHLSYRSGWLRAAVLGANDGILSVASVAIGVAASGARPGRGGDRRGGGAQRGGDVDGRWRVCLGELTARYRKR